MSHYLVTVSARDQTIAGAAGEPLYLLAGPNLEKAAVAQLCAELLHDPVVQQAAWYDLESLEAEALPAGTYAEIAYRPGVTDNEAESVLEGARRAGVAGLVTVRTLRRYAVAAPAEAAGFYNDLIQSALLYRQPGAAAERLAWYRQLLQTPADTTPFVAHVPLRQADDQELMRISREGILALDLSEMRAVRDYFAGLGHDPTDGELETIAQTWSEHCSHKTFKARVHYRMPEGVDSPPQPAQQNPGLYPMLQRLARGAGDQGLEIDSLIRTFLMEATRQILEQRRDGHDWVLSAFVDNAGIISFSRDYELSFKVETHNHPSALEPFGGANTGVGGVIRDVLGVSARPIANTDVLCFGMPATPAENLPPGVIHPLRTCAGVVAGVRDYGNKLGIPIVNGAVLFDPGYTANPLVFCGTVGLAPRGAHPRNVQPGDAIVVLGGRTGRDGIHGATFSSVELAHNTASEVGSAVQIGDPITEKKLLDVLLQARDQGLYNAITDCGAGGLSSAVGEMGEQTGAAVQLERVPLKYAGLQPWEIWLSEAQERMVLAVPPAKLERFLELCAGEEVEATTIGRFTSDRVLRVNHRDLPLVELDMQFLHHGRPQRLLEAVWRPATTPAHTGDQPAAPPALETLLLGLLNHPNIASREPIIRTYDHEVGGATVIKPLVGAAMDGPGDGAVLQPLPETLEGLAIGCGINPRYGRHDPYWMALACVDEALRNVVAVGGDPARTAILDNFCWGDPRQPDRMAGLVRAAAGCYDAALAFGTPYISGKDSLNNEYRDAEGRRVAIPPTLLISALAYLPDVTRSVTMDLKTAGNRLYLVGATRNELAGSHLLDLLPLAAEQAPAVDLALAPRLFAALHAAISSGLVRACHDLSEGGLAVAAAEMALAGELGLHLDLAAVKLADGDPVDVDPLLVKLFSETPSRLLVEVTPADEAAFLQTMAGLPCAPLGLVADEARLRIANGSTTLIDLAVSELKHAWQSGLNEVAL